MNADPNFEEMKRLLSMLGLRVHCRFVRRTSVDELRDYLRGPLNLLAYSDHLGRVLREYLSGSFGCVFADGASLSRIRMNDPSSNGVEIALPSLGQIDVIPKSLIGVQGTFHLLEWIMNVLLDR